MSQPRLTETMNGRTSLAVQVDAGVLHVTNDPGFTSENGDGCPYRAVALDGPITYGTHPPKRTAADFRWEGFIGDRTALAEWRKPLTPGPYRLRVYGGTLFRGWGDNPGDFIEWGADDLGQNPSGVPIVNEVEFVAPAVTPPPPAGSFPELRAHAVADLEDAIQLVDKPRSSAPAVYYAYRLLTATPEQRAKAFPALAWIFPK